MLDMSPDDLKILKELLNFCHFHLYERIGARFNSVRYLLKCCEQHKLTPLQAFPSAETTLALRGLSSRILSVELKRCSPEKSMAIKALSSSFFSKFLSQEIEPSSAHPIAGNIEENAGQDALFASAPCWAPCYQQAPPLPQLIFQDHFFNHLQVSVYKKMGVVGNPFIVDFSFAPGKQPLQFHNTLCLQSTGAIIERKPSLFPGFTIIQVSALFPEAAARIFDAANQHYSDLMPADRSQIIQQCLTFKRIHTENFIGGKNKKGIEKLALLHDEYGYALQIMLPPQDALSQKTLFELLASRKQTEKPGQTSITSLSPHYLLYVWKLPNLQSVNDLLQDLQQTNPSPLITEEAARSFMGTCMASMPPRVLLTSP